MGEGGQIWLKCITGDLIMMIRDKNDIFERVENFHADLAWNYPFVSSIFRSSRAPVFCLHHIFGSPPVLLVVGVVAASLRFCFLKHHLSVFVLLARLHHASAFHPCCDPLTSLLLVTCFLAQTHSLMISVIYGGSPSTEVVV